MAITVIPQNENLNSSLKRYFGYIAPGKEIVFIDSSDSKNFNEYIAFVGNNREYIPTKIILTLNDNLGQNPRFKCISNGKHITFIKLLLDLKTIAKSC